MGYHLLSIAKALAHQGQEFLFLDSAGHLHPNRDRASWLFCGELVEEFQGSLHNTNHLEELRQALLVSSQANTSLDVPQFAGIISYEGDFHFKRFSHILEQPLTGKDDAILRQGDAQYLHDLLQLSESSVDKSIPFLPQELQADSSDQEYLSAIERALDYIAAGDIYQVNLARRWSMPWLEQSNHAQAWELYLRWREQSHAPQSAFGKFGQTCFLSASPETFLELAPDGQMSTHPIKGTVRSSTNPSIDAQLRQSLQNSPKERAELLMITDLLRHDLGQVASVGSVQVNALHELESFGHLHHLVSSIQGQLKPECDVLELLRAMHPGGSITGAPKKRATEIIQELEVHPRSLYCGHIGWLGAKSCRFSVAIRSAYIKQEKLFYHAGSGIVADSNPQEELAETQLKASAFAKSLDRAKQEK